MGFLDVSRKGIYLDIGCGTGNYAIELHNQNCKVIGMDPSPVMLKIAKSRSQTIDWRIGHAEYTGLTSKAVDGVIAVLTIHHWTNLEKGFKELYRVIKKNGKVVIFTSTPNQMYGYWLNHYFPKMLKDSSIQMPSFDFVKNVLMRSGFNLVKTEPYFIHSGLEDLFLYCGKHKPKLYLKPEVRRGISSFASLGNIEEIKTGLMMLENDIESNKIDEIINYYNNELGDYLFLIAEKK